MPARHWLTGMAVLARLALGPLIWLVDYPVRVRKYIRGIDQVQKEAVAP